MEAAKDGSFYTLVIGEGVQAVGLVVNRVLGLREVVVRPLMDRLVKVPGIAGATELGDGRVVLILDVAKLFRIARQQTTTGNSIASLPSDKMTTLTGQNEGVQ
jgi:chemotaxis protein histidine kinase CheA